MKVLLLQSLERSRTKRRQESSDQKIRVHPPDPRLSAAHFFTMEQ